MPELITVGRILVLREQLNSAAEGGGSVVVPNYFAGQILHLLDEVIEHRRAASRYDVIALERRNDLLLNALNNAVSNAPDWDSINRLIDEESNAKRKGAPHASTEQAFEPR